jgi:hypothetical protein
VIGSVGKNPRLSATQAHPVLQQRSNYGFANATALMTWGYTNFIDP